MVTYKEKFVDIWKIALLASAGLILCLIGLECNSNPASAPPAPTVEFSTTPSSPAFMSADTISTLQVVDKNIGSLTLQVALSIKAKSAVAVPVVVSGASTAQSPADYSLGSNSIIIPAGDLIGSFSLSIVAPTAYEKSKMVFLSLGAPSNAGLGVNRIDTVALVDVNGFGQRYKFADNELTGWTQDTNTVTSPFTVWRADSLVGLWDGGAGLYLARGCLVTMVQNMIGPNGPDSQICEVVAMDFGTSANADSMFVSQIRSANVQVPIPGFDGAAAMAGGEMFGNIIGYAHFNQMYFEVQMSGYYDQSASSAAAGQLLKILQQKVN
jgi:hypothetical protein